MKIGLDIRLIESSGIGVTIRGLLDHLTPQQLNDLILFGPPSWEHKYAAEYVKVPYGIYGWSQQWHYPSLLKRHNIDLFHMPHYDFPLGYFGPFVVTIHDLIHYLFPEYSNKPFSKLYSSLMLRVVIKRSKSIITVSENTKKDLHDYLQVPLNKISVIHPGVSNDFKVMEGGMRDSVLKKYSLEPGYLLYVGNLRKSKNTSGLIKAYAKLRKILPEAPPLVLVGKNTIKEHQGDAFPPGVIYLGTVSYADLPALYSGATLFVFPTFYEGFGLPPLEAMACGTAVVTSKRASLPEVCGNAAEYVNPESSDEISRKLATLLEDSTLRQKMKDRGLEQVKNYDWNKFSQSIWNLYERIVADKIK